jgi:hypothetical protein
MGFSAKQVAALRRNVEERHVRTRQSITGKDLSYLEGWYVIAQANRIFGFDGWSRETLESKCVFARESRGYFTAVYTAKVRITVAANGSTIIREGHGTGEGRGEYPGEVHDTALKAAETDATKRALITFGRPFGLELYRDSQSAKQRQGSPPVGRALPLHPAAPPIRPSSGNESQPTHPAPEHGAASAAGAAQTSSGQQHVPSALPVQAAPELAPVAKYARDDTTPIPRPSTYYGREHFHDIREEAGVLVRQAARDAERLGSESITLPRTKSEPTSADAVAPKVPPSAKPAAPGMADELRRPARRAAPSLLPPEPASERIDKSVLPLGEPKRIRDKDHLRFVARQPCLVCGRQPSDAHHLRFAQPRALGMKVSDEFTVPLCRSHHRNLHQTGNELRWWENFRVEPLPVARKLWEETHPSAATQE